MIRARQSVLAIMLLAAAPASASEISILDGKTQPENLTVAPNGDILVGSFAAPKINVVKNGATTAEGFIDLSAEGPGSILGVLADGATGTLWACHLTPAPSGRRSNLRAFDLKSGAQKLRWDLPGDTSTCNDFSVGPDKALYIADTGGKIYRLPAGGAVGELWLDGPAVAGIDGIAFFNGQLYFNSIFSGKVYRVPRDGAGKAGTPVEIKLDTLLSRPDGMRAGNGKLFVGEGGAGRVVYLTIIGDEARVTMVKDGLMAPTGVQPAGDTLWYVENRAGKLSSVPMPQ